MHGDTGRRRVNNMRVAALQCRRGEPRATHDVDLAIGFRTTARDVASTLRTALPELQFDLDGSDHALG